jgi:hypothetical protein
MGGALRRHPCRVAGLDRAEDSQAVGAAIIGAKIKQALAGFAAVSVDVGAADLIGGAISPVEIRRL